jgi:hypothetical protein
VIDSSVTEINLSYSKENFTRVTKLGRGNTDEFFRFFIDSLEGPSAIRVLNLMGLNQFPFSFLLRVFLCLKLALIYSSSYSLLPLESNVTDTTAERLGFFLRKNTSIERLHLPWNKISDKGAKSLASALKINNSVKSIDLKCKLVDSLLVVLLCP